MTGEWVERRVADLDVGDDVKVARVPGLYCCWSIDVRVGHHVLAVAKFVNREHAEEYAARLRSSAHDRALALGKDTT